MTSFIDLQPAPHRAGPDYTPVAGQLPPGIDMAHGIIQSGYKGRPTTAGAAIARRCLLHGSTEPNCHNQALLLPPATSDLLHGVRDLVRLYESGLIPNQRDLLGITTLRFDPMMPCHAQWEIARGFAWWALCRRKLAVQLVHHVPGLAGRSHKPHVHLLWPVRELDRETFGPFTSLTEPGAKAILASEWATWLKVCG